MKMFLFNREQEVKRWLVDRDFIEAKMTEQINTADKLVFSVPLKKRLPTSYFFAAIPQPRGSGYLLFKIVTEQVQSNRVQYTCVEAAYDELKSYHYIKDDRPQDRSATDMLQMALDGTRWSVGTAYDAGTGSTNFYYISSLEAIQKIANLFQLEVVFSIILDPRSHQITRRLVNLYAQQGERTGKRFEYGSNLLSVEREESSENLITALIGRGKGEEKYHTADGKPAEEDQTPDGYGRRINFADVVWSTKNGNPVDKPAGQEYVEDPDATAAYGFDDGKPRIGIEIFEDITDPGELLQATWSALQTLKRPKVSFKANTLDVGDLGLGDTVAIIRHDIKIEYFTRVYKVEHNLLNEKQNTIELGDDFNSQSITSAINSIASAVKQTSQTANYASVSANGKNTNNYGKDRPSNAVEGDLWYKDLGNGEVDLYQYHDGNWILITSTHDLHNVQKQVEKAQSELDTAKNDIIANKQKADTDIENLNKSIEANKKTADESLQKLNDSVANLQGQYDNNIVPDLNKAAADAADALQKYIEAQKSITDLTKQAQQQDKNIADVTSTVNGLNINYASLAGDVSSTKADVKGLQTTIGTANGDIAQLKLDAQSLQTMLAGKVDDSVYQNFVTLTNQALAAKLTASDLAGYAKTVDVQATANGLQLNIDSVNGRLDNLKIGGRNLAAGTAEPYIMGYGIPNTTWQNGYAYESLPTKILTGEILPQNDQFFANLVPGQEYTQTIWFETDADVKKLNAAITWFTSVGHDEQPAKIIKVGENSYKLFSTYTWPGKTDNNVRLFDIFYLQDAFDLTTGTYLKFGKLKLEVGNTSTDWTPAPEDVANDITQLSARITANSQQFSSYYTKFETDAKADTAKNDAINAIKGDASWTGLTNIITNSGFLQSADGFVQKVQQTTLPMFNGGGVNLLKETSPDWKTLTGSVWFCQSTSAGAVEIGSLSPGDVVTYSITVRNNSQYTVRPEIVGFSDDNGTRSFSISGTESFQPGETKTVSVSATVAENTVKIIGWLISSGAEPTFSVDAKNEKLERGSVATPWSPNPADLATQVAFTELTQTVNGLQSTVSNNYTGLQTQITQQADNFNVSLNALRGETAWQKVTTAIDANNYTTTGNYWIQALPNSNTPDGSAWAYLQVVAYPDVKRIKQTWQRDNNANEAFTRLKTDNGWSDWQKTVTAGNIMAQINMSAGTTLIQNNKIYMDAASTVFSGKAFIPSAAITSLEADKITTGTLNAGEVNIVNMNADNITTGTINGQNLKIDLNSGTIEFQHGKITSTSGTLDIDIDNGKMSVTNTLNQGFYFQDGELSLSDNWWDVGKYGGIRWNPTLVTAGYHGMELHSPYGVVLNTDDCKSTAFPDSGFSLDGDKGAGIFIGHESDLGTPSDKGTIQVYSSGTLRLYGGLGFSESIWNSQAPGIEIGINNVGGADGSHPGSRVAIHGDYVHIASAYERTTGNSPNVFVALDGALVRSTSASKYKTAITRSHSLDYGERLLSLPTATWFDKAEEKRFASGESKTKPVMHFGMIAEDLADAGLEMLVSRGQDGELEGIQYDRITPALLPVIKKLQDRIKKLEERLNG